MQPAGYFEGGDLRGIGRRQPRRRGPHVSIPIGSGVNAVHYDFYELIAGEDFGLCFPGRTGDTGQKRRSPARYPLDPRRPAHPGRYPTGRHRSCNCATAAVSPCSTRTAIPSPTVTNSEGYYEFTGLAPGDYSIIAQTPDGYIPGVDTAGSKGGMVVNRYAKIDPLSAEHVGGGSARQRDREDRLELGRGGRAVQFQRGENNPAARSAAGIPQSSAATAGLAGATCRLCPIPCATA